VAQDGYALKYAAAELRSDRFVVLAAVAQGGDAMQYAATELKADRDIVLAAVVQSGLVLYSAAAELRADPALRELSALNPRVSVRLLNAQSQQSAYAPLTRGGEAGTAARGARAAGTRGQLQ
jgi:hypothetical protein